MCVVMKWESGLVILIYVGYDGGLLCNWLLVVVLLVINIYVFIDCVVFVFLVELIKCDLGVLDL